MATKSKKKKKKATTGKTTAQVLKVGSAVKWSSQAGGKPTEKFGKIVAKVPAGKDPGKTLARLQGKNRKYAQAFDSVNPSGHLRFLVAVDRPGKQKPKLYIPKTSYLQAHA